MDRARNGTTRLWLPRFRDRPRHRAPARHRVERGAKAVQTNPDGSARRAFFRSPRRPCPAGSIATFRALRRPTAIRGAPLELAERDDAVELRASPEPPPS